MKKLRLREWDPLVFYTPPENIREDYTIKVTEEEYTFIKEAEANFDKAMDICRKKIKKAYF